MDFVFAKYLLYLHQQNKKWKSIYNGTYILLNATKTQIKSEYAIAFKDLASLISKTCLTNNYISTSSLNMVQKVDK
jgi:hypothetical protein